MGQLDYLKSFPSLVFNKVATKVDGTVTNEVILATDGEPQGNWLISIPVEESLENGDVEVVEGINVLTLMTRETYSRDITQKFKEWDKKIKDLESKLVNQGNSNNSEINSLKSWVTQQINIMKGEYNTRIDNAITECKKYTDQKMKENLPIGSIICAGVSAPSIFSSTTTKYLLLDGSVVTSNSYPDLARAINNAYGNSTGASSFRLPYLIEEGYFIGGCSVRTTPTFKDWGLPNIKGSRPNIAESDNSSASGCLANPGGWNAMSPKTTDGSPAVGVSIDLSLQTEYKTHTNLYRLQPVNYQAYFFIKYRQ